MAKVLDYENLVSDYSANLDVTLRGFRPATEIKLDTWVPDENPLRSLASLVEAAQLCGSDAVSVRVRRQTLEGVGEAELQERLAAQGLCAVAPEADAVVITVSGLQDTAAFGSVRAIYRDRMRARLGALRFRRELKGNGEAVVLKATEENRTLIWLVNGATHAIADAAFASTARGPVEAALDCLCELLVGLPVAEARDHGIIRLEHALRDRHAPAPVAGIILPQNADGVFRLPARLVTRLYDDYLDSSGYRPAMNEFDPSPAASWTALSAADREQRLTAAIAENRKALAIEDGDVQVVECRRPTVVTIRMADRVSIPVKRTLALAVERLVRQHCDPRLEVFCEETKDMSRLRRQIESAAKG